MAYFKKIISLQVLLCFLMSFVFSDFAYAVTGIAQTEQSSGSSAITGAGEIINITAFPESKILFINIQDIHANPLIQKNIVKILNDLTGRFNVEKIYIEGASGSVNTGFMKALNKTNPEIVENFFQKDICRRENISLCSRTALNFTELKIKTFMTKTYLI